MTTALESKTIEEFEEKRHQLECRHCGRVGVLFLHLNPNNNATEIHCPCSGYSPIAGTPHLRKTPRPSTARPRGKVGVPEADVWAQWGNRCAHCGTHREDLQTLGIGLQLNHQPPLESVDNESECTLVPICSCCHYILTAHQKTMQRLVAKALNVGARE